MYKTHCVPLDGCILQKFMICCKYTISLVYVSFPSLSNTSFVFDYALFSKLNLVTKSLKDSVILFFFSKSNCPLQYQWRPMFSFEVSYFFFELKKYLNLSKKNCTIASSGLSKFFFCSRNAVFSKKYQTFLQMLLHFHALNY